MKEFDIEIPATLRLTVRALSLVKARNKAKRLTHGGRPVLPIDATVLPIGFGASVVCDRGDAVVVPVGEVRVLAVYTHGLCQRKGA
jgi:hypothetical protein